MGATPRNTSANVTGIDAAAEGYVAALSDMINLHCVGLAKTRYTDTRRVLPDRT